MARIKITRHPVYGKRPEMKIYQCKDGWYYTNIGLRFKGEKYKNSIYFKTIWNMEEWLQLR